MKLRNKKTGEIKDFENLQVYAESENTNESQFLGNFDSFKKILEYYEDYIPKEPLIKDEKIRKAVRAWADANKFSIFIVNNKQSNTFEIRGLTDIGDAYGCSIYFKGIISKTNNITYTISELCGEEE